MKLVLIFTMISFLFSQETPFLKQNEIQMLINEISGDRAFEHIRVLTQWHRDSGMDGYFKAADYIVEKAKENGLVDVKFIEQKLGRPNYTAISAELWVTDPIEIKLADIGDHALFLADGSYSADLSAELIYVGNGSKDALSNLDVKGKIVLTSNSPGAALFNAVYEKGAVGIVCYTNSESKSMLDFPDQLAWTRISSNVPKDKKGSFAFNLSSRRGELLRKILDSKNEQDFFSIGKKFKGGKLVVKAKVITKFTLAPTGRTGFVEGWIKGTTYHDEAIVLTAHLQEEQGSANDDGSGSGNILELARVFTKLIKEGKIPQPKRDIRIWWSDEISSEYSYFRENPEQVNLILANLHQDMTGAKQSIGSRVQHLIFAPHSRLSYLDAIFESIGSYVIKTNNSFITMGRSGGLPRPHSVQIYANRGTREGFNARFVPYFDSSDNLVFVEGAFGIPSVALINWDDEYIHSTDDDLWQIDQTQLKRNNFIIAGMALYLMNADSKDADLLASETFAQGLKRLANDFDYAQKTILASSNGSDAWKMAVMFIDQGIEREQNAIKSINKLAKTTESKKIVTDLSNQYAGIKVTYLKQIEVIFTLKFSSSNSSVILSTEELAASKKIPKNVLPFETYFSKRDEVDYRGTIHGTMAGEVYNFVDGKRTYLEIYQAVKTESMVYGKDHYGVVILADVVGLLDSAVSKGALVLVK